MWLGYARLLMKRITTDDSAVLALRRQGRQTLDHLFRRFFCFPRKTASKTWVPKTSFPRAHLGRRVPRRPPDVMR